MAYAQVPDKRTLAIPGKVRSKIGERNLLVGELPKSGVPNDIGPKSARPESQRARNFNQGRRVKLDAGKRFAQPEGIEKGFQIHTAAHLDIGAIGFVVPISAGGKIAFGIGPLAMANIQALVIPFGISG